MRRPYDDGRLSGQGRYGVAQRHVEVLSYIDGEHVTVKRMGSIVGCTRTEGPASA